MFVLVCLPALSRTDSGVERAQVMTRTQFLATIAAFFASTASALGAPPGVPPVNPPHDAPGRVRSGPAPVLGAGWAIIAAGAALAGYALRRRRRRPTDDT
jgi:hypothetical protein